MTDKHTYMQRAVEISGERMHAGDGGPFGAVIVKDSRIVGIGHNNVTSSNDPTAHAEVTAIRDACKNLDTFSLQGAEIFTSCEPCPMCLSAIYWARLDHIYYANSREDAARIGFDDAFLYDEVAKDPKDRSLPMDHIEVAEAAEIFQEWINKEDKVRY